VCLRTRSCQENDITTLSQDALPVMFPRQALDTIPVHSSFNVLFGDDNPYSRRFFAICDREQRACAIADLDLRVVKDKLIVFSAQ